MLKSSEFLASLEWIAPHHKPFKVSDVFDIVDQDVTKTGVPFVIDSDGVFFFAGDFNFNATMGDDHDDAADIPVTRYAFLFERE